MGLALLYMKCVNKTYDLLKEEIECISGGSCAAFGAVIGVGGAIGFLTKVGCFSHFSSGNTQNTIGETMDACMCMLSMGLIGELGMIGYSIGFCLDVLLWLSSKLWSYWDSGPIRAKTGGYDEL